MKTLALNPAYEDRLAQAQCTSFESILALSNGAPGFLIRALPGGSPLPVFFKLYCPSSRWRFWGRKSKARREAENAAALRQLDLPVADWMAWGEERDAFGRLRRAFILSTALPDVCRLDEFHESRPAAADRALVVASLAALVARMHRAHFFYYDLHWRNILVQRQPGRPLQVYLIDCPRGGFARFGLERRRLHDLATLDKTAAMLCSRTERLRFLQQYLGRQATREQSHQAARDCLNYRRNRWPAAWQNGQNRSADEAIRISQKISESAQRR